MPTDESDHPHLMRPRRRSFEQVRRFYQMDFMKTLGIIKYTFLAIGIALLLGAGVIGQHTRSFLSNAVSTDGIVVALDALSDRGSTTYRPIIRFQTPSGNVEFRSSSGSNPPRYTVGDTVPVLYSPDKPNDARPDAFFSLWGAATITAGIGLVFFTIGAAMIGLARRSSRREAYLRTQGVPVQARVQGIEENESIQVNGRSPYRIMAQWQDPATSQIHLFYSGNIWFDPTEYVTREHITVLLDRKNPKRYHVDVSFLPQLAT